MKIIGPVGNSFLRNDLCCLSLGSQPLAMIKDNSLSVKSTRLGLDQQ